MFVWSETFSGKPVVFEGREMQILDSFSFPSGVHYKTRTAVIRPSQAVAEWPTLSTLRVDGVGSISSSSWASLTFTAASSGTIIKSQILSLDSPPLSDRYVGHRKQRMLSIISKHSSQRPNGSIPATWQIEGHVREALGSTPSPGGVPPSSSPRWHVWRFCSGPTHPSWHVIQG